RHRLRRMADVLAAHLPRRINQPGDATHLSSFLFLPWLLLKWSETAEYERLSYHFKGTSASPHNLPAPPDSFVPLARRFLIAAAALLLCRLAVSLLLVPPWQMADEQAHVSVSEFWRNHRI